MSQGKSFETSPEDWIDKYTALTTGQAELGSGNLEMVQT